MGYQRDFKGNSEDFRCGSDKFQIISRIFHERFKVLCESFSRFLIDFKRSQGYMWISGVLEASRGISEDFM